MTVQGEPTPLEQPARLAGRLRPVVALAGTLSACSGGSSDGAGAHPAAWEHFAAAPDTCPAEREPLTLSNGTQAYIEPQNLLVFDSGVLIAGVPSYAWDVGSAPNAVLLSRDRYVAAYIGPVDNRAVAMPIDVTPGSVRAVPLDDGRWAALVTEVEADSLPAKEQLQALWYGEHDGEQWTVLEPVPVPDEGELAVRASSSLVRLAGGLAWAVVQYLPERRAKLLYYERRGGRWHVEVVSEAWVEAAALGYGSGTGVWLALVAEDADLPGWQKSLRLYHHTSAWELVRRVAVAAAGTEIYEPRVTVLPGGVTVSWRSISSESSLALARVGIGPGDDGTELLLDESAEQVLPLTTTDGVPSWVVDHLNPVTQTRELRLVRASRRGPRRIRAVPSPYRGFVAATATDRNEVLVVGPEFSPDPARPTVRSLILRLSTLCA